MKAYTKLNTNMRKFTFLRTNSFNKFQICNFSSNNQNEFKSHFEQIQDKDAEFVNRVTNSNNYTVSDFSNFMRVVNKTRNPELIEKFVQEVPKHISKLDDLDLRKVISIVCANPKLHEETNLIHLIKSRNSELALQNGIEIRKDFYNFSEFPLAVRFWVGYAKFREIMYGIVRKFGISLK